MKPRAHLKPLLIGGSLMVLSACTVGGYQISSPFNSQNGLNVGTQTVSTNGIVDRGSYKAVIAGEGDTLASLAARAGLSGEALARHNGLPSSYLPKTGEEFALPVGANAGAGVSVSSTPFDATGGDSTITATTLGSTTPLVGETITHRVAAGETAYSIARLYGVSVSSLSAWNSLPADLSISEGQSLVIPADARPNATAPTDSVVTATPTAPVPAPAPATTTPSGGGGSFVEPVSGSITTKYNPANNSDGIVYTTANNAGVRAASDGKVVLVSESTGSQGTIVMVQHPNGLISVYGKMGGLNVSKGDQVASGQSLGSTAADQLLFQLRRGTTSVDPVTYF